VLVDPAVAPDPVVVELHLVLGALDQLHLAEAMALDPRALLPVLLGEIRLPDVGGLHYVVVDADDLRDVHAATISRGPDAAVSQDSFLERDLRLDPLRLEH